MKNTIKVLGIIALIAVIGVSFITCSNSDDDEADDKGNSSNSSSSSSSSERWRVSKYKQYTVTNGSPSLSSETVYNWITYNYKSDTNYEYKYTITTTTYIPTTSTSSATYRNTRNGQTEVYEYTTTSGTTTQTSNQTTTYNSAGKKLQSIRKSTTTSGTSTETRNETTTYNSIYDSIFGIPLKSTRISTYTTTSGTTTTSIEISYNTQLFSDSGGEKLYKMYINNYIINGKSQDYPEEYNAQYEFYSNNPIILAKLGNYGIAVGGYGSAVFASKYTFEVISDSTTELVIRNKMFTNNVLSSYTDNTYEKVKL